MNKPLHERVAQHDAAHRRIEIGLGAAQAPRIGRLPRSSTGIAAVPRIASRKLGPIGDQEEHEDAALERHLAQPDRSVHGRKPIRAARVIGLEDRRGKEQRPIVVAPAEQTVIGVEPGVAHQALVGGPASTRRSRSIARRESAIR